MGYLVERHIACISESCKSSDALSLYEEELEDGSVIYNAHCYSCKGFFTQNQLADSYIGQEYGITKLSKNMGGNVQPKVKRKPPSPVISDEQKQDIQNNTVFDSTHFRSIHPKVNKRFNVLTEFNNDGKVVKRYYPVTEDKKLAGYKIRVVATKDFYSVGRTGSPTDLFGKATLKEGGKYCGLFSGEEDAMAAYQMLAAYQHSRGNGHYDPIPCVAPSTSESSSLENIRENYKYFESFERVIVCFDDDEIGREYAEKVADVLPAGKAYIMFCPKGCKDANDALAAGRDKEFISGFYSAKKIVPEAIVSSSDLGSAVREELMVEKIPLPPFMSKLQEFLAGGIPLGYIVNIGAACVDADTEFFSGSGWKRIADYQKGDKVSQWDQGSMELVEPLSYIKEPCAELSHITTKHGIDQVLSDEHRVVFWDEHNTPSPTNVRELRFKQLKEKHESNKTGFRGRVATTFNYEGKGIDYTEGELRLQVAVMADGRIVKEGKNNYTQIRFKKERKYLRLKSLCARFGLKFDDRGLNNQGQYEVIVWPKTSDKHYSEEYFNCTKEQASIIIDEMVHWDGYEKTKTYHSTNKGDADFIQFCFAQLGYRSSISVRDKEGCNLCYSVHPVLKNSSYAGFRSGSSGKKAEIVPYATVDGFKYCFEVPSSYLVLRRNGHIFVTGNSGIGKTSIINEMLYYWLFFSPHKVGVVSLELSKGQYGMAMLSRHLERKLSLFSDPAEAISFLDLPENKERELELWTAPDGEARWYLLDEREGTIDNLKKRIMQLVVACQCKVIVLDPLQDVLDSSTNEEQADFMRFQKQMVKQGVTFVNINHVRKSGTGDKAGSQGKDLVEEDFAGSSTIFKSGGINLLVMRDKYNEDIIIRNTTRVVLSKCRTTGLTGPAGEWYYDNNTHTLHDKETFFANNTIEASIPEDQDSFVDYIEGFPPE